MKLREIQGRKSESNEEETIWRDAILKFSHRIRFNASVLEALDAGLEIESCLQLPQKYSFLFNYLRELFMSDSVVRPFKHVK